MSFTDEYLKLRKKRLEEESRNGKARTNNNVLLDTLFSNASSDIAPVRLTEQEQWMASSGDKKWYQEFFKGSSLFDDGYQFGDVSKTVGASAADLGVDILKGAGRLVEGVTDLVGHGAAGVADLFGQEEWADSFRDDVNKSWVDEVSAPTDEYLNNYSVLGSTSDAVGEGLGQVAAIILTGGALGAAGASAAGITAGTTGLIGASSMGSGMSEAYLGGATDKDALKYGALKGVIDAGTELIFGGLGKAVNAVGLSHGLTSLDDMLAKGLSSKISNRILHNLIELGVKASAEGLEEVLAGWGTAVAKKFTYMSEEELSALIKDESLLEQFIVGAITSGIAQSGLVPGTRKGSFIDAVKQDQDFVTRLGYTEEAVINKVYNDRVLEAEQDGKKLSAKEQNQIYEDVLNDLEKGRIDTDAIEAVWGGGGAATEMMVKGTKLAESYNEKARRGQAFQANVTQYAANQRDTIQKAIASGVLNNTNRTHEFVDLIAKISADKGVSFDFTNNKKLKESGFAINGADVNAYINNGGITLNMDSRKAWQSTVGHEITHVLEGTELYAEMQRVLFDYAKSKGDYQRRYDSLMKLYKGVEGANIDAELTADLVGDYLFTDENFVKHLSSQNRNIFQKIYDEIKYLWKLVTAGSKEARDLERVKRAFDKAYKESGKASEGTKYSLDMVNAVKPTTNKWKQSATTDEVRAAHPTLYAVDETATEERNPTQVKGTVGSYRKVYESLKNEGFNGTILDASSGLGYGTKAGIEEYGFDVEDIEPYPDSGYKPKYTDYSALNKKYDVVISNAVLNVLPQDQRDALTVKMGELLNPGGRMFVNVRGKDVLSASGKIAINESNMEYFIPRTAKTGSYQKGFTKSELVAYLEDALGKGFTVKPTNMFGAVSAIVTKDGSVKYSISDKKYLDKYSQKQYNDFGWAREADAVTQNELDDMNSKIQVKRSFKKFPQSFEGEAIIEVNDKPHTTLAANNTFLFVKGTVNSPEITKVVKVNLFDEDSIEVFRKDIYESSSNRTLETYARRIGDEFIQYYDRNNHADYREYTNKSRSRISGSEGEGNPRANRKWIFGDATDAETQSNDIAPIKASSKDGVFFDGKNTKYSLSEANKEYLSALKRGDDETAQQMVDDAAENAGYNLQMYYQPDGKDIRVWCDIGGKQREAIVHSLHGTPYGIPTEMIDENRKFGDNAHLTLYVKAKNTFIIDNRAEVKKYLPELLPYYDEMARIDEKYSALTKELGDAETDLLNKWGNEHYQGDYPDLDYLPIVERLSEGKPGINSPEYLTAYNERARVMEEWKTESNKIAAKCKEIITELLRNNGYDSIYFKGDSSKPDNFILLDANQIKSGDTVAYDNKGKYISLSKRFNTGKNDIRYSLTEYTTEEKKSHNKAVLDHFGKTNKWDETGYLLLDGTKLDLSGKHDGAPGGYRTVDHRDITEALGYDYGGGDYSGSLVQFMREGNIRIVPEINGFNLSVKPTKAQEQALSDFISRARGEVVLDIDDLNGNTVVSVEYPRGTYHAKVLNDIREWFDNGKQPETSGLSAFRSLTKKGDTPKRYGNYYTPLKELKIDKSIKKSIEGTNTQALINRNMVNANKEEELIAPIADDYAPIGNVGGNVTKNVVDDQNGTKKKRGFIDGLKKSTTKARTHLVDNYSVFEDLALKTGNRELDAKANFMRYSEQRAQHFIGHGADGVRALEDLRKEVKASGLDQEFQEYMYDMHNTDRMSLEKRAKSMLRKFSKQFKELKPERVKAIAARSITAQTTAKTAQTIRDARQYLNLLELRNKPVRGEHYTAEISQANAARLEAMHPQFKEWAQDIYKITDYLRAKLVEDGEISQETADLWAEIYPHYVPIRRLDNSGAAVGEQYIQQTGLTGHLDEGNNTGVNAPIKRATGGNSDIDDLFRTLAMRAEQTYKAGAKNRFGLELKDTLATTINRSQASFDEMVDGVETHEQRLKKGENGTKSTFTVFENGERVEFEITDEMYEALRPANDLFSGTNKVLNAATKFQRGALTQYNPFFTLRNIAKDAQDVFINSQHAAKTYAKMPTAISELAKHARGASTKWAKEYFENGGEQNTYFDSQELKFKKEDSTWKKVLGFVPRKISEISNFVERAPRLAEYIASREAGKSIEGAMLDSARVTTNFAAGGDVTKWANRNGFTFLNASIQGAAQQVRNVREAKANGLKGMLKLGAKFMAAGLPFVLLNSLMWDDDDDYEELSDYVKENYYIIAKYGDGQFVRIPKGRAMAVIQNAFEQMGNLITGDDEVDFERFGQLLVENLAPNNPIENNVFAPVMDAFDNKTWYGDDLVPTRLQDLPAAEQYDETTDSISKWIGENTDTSPYKWNYLLDQYSGVFGDMLLPMLTPQAERGDNSLAGNLIAPLKDQFTTDSVLKNQNVSDFYDTVDELAKNANSRYATDDDILKYKYMNSVNADLSELYKQKREIQNSNLADAEKYEVVRQIQKQIDELTEESLSTYGNVNIDGVYATVGNSHFRWYEPSGDSEAEPGWQKISDTQLAKQQVVTSSLGISPSTYWNNKSEYDFAYEYPGRYGIAKSVGGYENYKYYASDLYDIKADKDTNGKTIAGSRKEKVADYINGLDISYEEKIILFKSEYTSDDTYNREIIDYLNNREDISYEEMIAILQELGFTVKGNTVTWG